MKLLHRLTLLYLLLPFALFVLGWLRLIFALPLIALLIWAFIQLDRNSQFPVTSLQSPISIYQLLITAFWLLLSGIGGYAFQNWDHNWRNAVFHDLIRYDLPVVYAAPEVGPIKMLVYYVGYWLPAVWVGKFFGWQAANFALFAWTFGGLTLVFLHLSDALQTSALKASLLLIFFSGMDALGALLYPDDYPKLFPPFSHLEVWMDHLQYSSMTTQLFWVFNQAVPAWLCFLLLLTHRRIEVKLLAGALCFFFAPLVAVSMFFYLLLDGIQELRLRRGAFFKEIRWDVFAAAFLIFAVSFLYFSSNTAAQTRGFNGLPLSRILPFVLLEGGAMWLLLLARLWRSPRFMLTGILLALIPFFQIGSGTDFVMRVSIAPLFFLMLSAGKALFDENSPRLLRAVLAAMLLVGALTPLYEINRSMYRTVQYYSLEESARAKPARQPAKELIQGGVPEYENPNAIIADNIYSLEKLRHKLVLNFVANVRRSFYYKYLAPR